MKKLKHKIFLLETQLHQRHQDAHKGDIDSAPPKTITEHWEEILEKAESFAGTSKQ